jgi:hypothetical protein
MPNGEPLDPLALLSSPLQEMVSAIPALQVTLLQERQQHAAEIEGLKARITGLEAQLAAAQQQSTRA